MMSSLIYRLKYNTDTLVTVSNFGQGGNDLTVYHGLGPKNKCVIVIREDDIDDTGLIQTDELGFCLLSDL